MKQQNQTTVVIYSRGADNTTIDNKLHDCLYRAAQWLNIEWLDADTAQKIVSQDQQDRVEPTVVNPENSPVGIVTLSDFIPETAGFDGALNGLQNDEHASHLIVSSLNDLPTDNKDTTVSDVLEHIVDKLCVDLHVADDGITIRAGTTPTGSVIRALIDSDTGDAEKHTGGRPPLGMVVENGFLTPGAKYDDVCDALQLFRDGAISKREAARRIGCARKTVERASNRTELYNLV